MSNAISKKFIIPNVDNLKVSSNEYSINFTIQRIIDKLFENDLALKKFYEVIFGQFMIYEYDPGSIYEYNQLIWFKDNDKDLHILRCDVNKMLPNSLAEYPSKSFASIGWKDLNPDIDILTEYGIEKRLNNYITKMFKQHTDDVNMHKYGKIAYDKSGRYALNAKVALNDFSNLDSHREEIFFPYQTVCLGRIKNKAITNGYARWYDNGLLEYDIVFRLSYVGYQEVDKDYHISADILSCNNLDLTNEKSCDNYFMKPADMSIFSYTGLKSGYEAEIGDTVQRNRNDYVNVYYADIEFAAAAANGVKAAETLYQFADTNYMVFASDVLSQNRDTKTANLNPTPNTLMFCNKQVGKLTAVLVTYPYRGNYTKTGLNAQSTGLQSNSFHCHIVGKGKTRS